MFRRNMFLKVEKIGVLFASRSACSLFSSLSFAPFGGEHDIMGPNNKERGYGLFLFHFEGQSERTHTKMDRLISEVIDDDIVVIVIVSLFVLFDFADIYRNNRHYRPPLVKNSFWNDIFHRSTEKEFSQEYRMSKRCFLSLLSKIQKKL